MEASTTVLHDFDRTLGAYTMKAFDKRSITVRTGSLVKSVAEGHVVLDNGDEIPYGLLVWSTGILWVPETIVMLWPTGMVSVINGTIDDGYNGLLGWFWIACVVTTIGLVVVTRAALREREYSAVMAATGLMCLAIVTAFGQDLVARVLLAP